jgi:hypothetical protein
LVEAEDLHGRGLSFQGMRSPVDKSGRSRHQRVDALAGKQDRVTGSFGELLDAGRDVDGVADQSELQLCLLPRRADAVVVTDTHEEEQARGCARTQRPIPPSSPLLSISPNLVTHAPVVTSSNERSFPTVSTSLLDNLDPGSSRPPFKRRSSQWPKTST